MSSIISYIKSFLQSILTSLGLYQKNGTILLLGLDNAGKTTLLHKLRTNRLKQFSPTERPHCETFYMEDIKFVGWDLGGHEAVRHMWSDYAIMDTVSAVLFMIDAADFDRLEEVRDELDFLVNGNGNGNAYDGGTCSDDFGLKHSGVPLALLLNKVDLEHAQSSDVIAEGIGFEEILDGYGEMQIDQSDDENENENERATIAGEEMVKMFRISVYNGKGYQDAFRWISTFL